MPHTDSVKVTHVYDSSGRFLMYEPDRPNTFQQSSEAMMQSIEAMQRRGIPTHRS